MTDYPLDAVSLEILGATTGFIIGRAHAGVDRLDDSASLSWLPILSE